MSQAYREKNAFACLALQLILGLQESTQLELGKAIQHSLAGVYLTYI